MNYICPCGLFNGEIVFQDGEKLRLVPCPSCYVEEYELPAKPYRKPDGTLMSRDEVIASAGSEGRLKAHTAELGLTAVGSTLKRSGVLIEINDDGSTTEARRYDKEATHNLTKDKARDVKP